MRIASLAPSVTEILYELGAGQDIVCSTIYCDYPESAKNLPKVGSWLNVDFEQLKQLRPDIVFTSTAVQGNLTDKLRNTGFQVVNINPTRLSEVIDSYQQIGQLTGHSEEAEKISKKLYQQLMGLYLNGASKDAPKVYCEEWSAPPMAAGNWVPDVVELAGGRYGLVKPGELSREVDTRDLLDYNPDLIVLHVCGMGEGVDTSVVTKRAGWERVRAVQEGNIFAINDSLLNRPTSRLFSGLDKLKEIIGQVR